VTVSVQLGFAGVFGALSGSAPAEAHVGTCPRRLGYIYENQIEN